MFKCIFHWFFWQRILKYIWITLLYIVKEIMLYHYGKKISIWHFWKLNCIHYQHMYENYVTSTSISFIMNFKIKEKVSTRNKTQIISWHKSIHITLIILSLTIHNILMNFYDYYDYYQLLKPEVVPQNQCWILWNNITNIIEIINFLLDGISEWKGFPTTNEKGNFDNLLFLFILFLLHAIIK